ncbi:hypothetical protein D6D02_06086, partial [Aureobasidium pullulans]
SRPAVRLEGTFGRDRTAGQTSARSTHTSTHALFTTLQVRLSSFQFGCRGVPVSLVLHAVESPESGYHKTYRFGPHIYI